MGVVMSDVIASMILDILTTAQYTQTSTPTRPGVEQALRNFLERNQPRPVRAI
jgi:hypothetical protein